MSEAVTEGNLLTKILWLGAWIFGILLLFVFIMITSEIAVFTIFVPDSKVPTELVGKWEGKCKIANAWCRQEELPIALTINEDGSAEGTIGDAEFSSGKLVRGRSWVGKLFNFSSDYRIRGRLEGAIVEDEGIVRERMRLFVNLEGEEISVYCGTNGHEGGGKEDGMLWTWRSNLRRIQ